MYWKKLEKTVNPEHTEAYVETTISYYFKTEGNIKKINLNQKWWLNKDLNQWFIDQPFPKFDQPLLEFAYV